MMYDELVKSPRICGDWENAHRFPGKDGCDGCAYHDEANDVCNSWDADNRKENIMLQAADAIEELSKPRWIPVTERLPDVGETVWAVYSNSLFPNGKSWHKTLKYDGEIWIDENGYRYLPANITHWQERDPLPEPPKEKT